MGDRDMLREVVASIISDQVEDMRRETRAIGWAQRLWNSFAEAGLTGVLVHEKVGGSGGDLQDLATILKVSGYYAAPVPLAEANIAALVLAETGRPIPREPVTIVPRLAGHPAELFHDHGRWRITGTLSPVPWAGPADSLVIVAEPGDRPDEMLVGVASTSDCLLSLGCNVAGEPLADVQLPTGGVELATVPADSGLRPGGVWSLSVIARALLMVGSLRRVLDLSVRYSHEREQFGRPIIEFQAVAQQLAELAGAVEQAEAIVDTAVAALLGGKPCPELLLAAWIRASEAATVAIGISHQVHGAIGVTLEHELHHHTRRLMARRDEGGSETRSSLELGRQIADGGADKLWTLLTQTEGMST